jgi:predicted nucleic acid-binding protein
MRIFLDANILFSAAKSAGAVRALVSRLLAARHECWVDGYVAEEARRNILAKDPKHLPELDRLIARLRLSSAVPDVARAKSWRGIAEKDRPVVAAAAALGCDILVTGDRSHFGTLYGRSLAGMTIHSPRSLYEHLFGS